MDLPAGLRLSIESRPAAADIDKIGNALDAYNREFLGDTGYSRMGLFVRDGGGEIMAGPYHSPLGVFSGNGPTDEEKKWAAETLRKVPHP